MCMYAQIIHDSYIYLLKEEPHLELALNKEH